MPKKLLEYKNEEAASILTDILDPASEIFSDKDFIEALAKSKIDGVKIALKKHGKAVIDVLAVYEGIPREEYSVNPLEIISKTISIFHDIDMMSAFTSQEQKTES